MNRRVNIVQAACVPVRNFYDRTSAGRGKELNILVTPAAIYILVLSTGSGSVRGEAVFGDKAASAICEIMSVGILLECFRDKP